MLDILKGKKLEEVLASILFVSGDGIEIKDIKEKLDLKDKEIDNAIEKLKERYCGECGINVITYKGKIQLSSNKSYAECVTEVLNPIKEKLLTKKALEVIAIVAYKQPITKLEIEQIRGTNSDYSIQMLLQHNLIEVVGRKDAVGKPLLYGTTEEFLKRFGLEDIDCLPDYEEILERIKVVHRDDNSLYRTFEIPDDEVSEEGEESLPEFLEGEEDLRLVE
ncbi:MAG: SMC-Scp complex subunit ScpB [Clostridia bacterium]|nr:SMC-Scp complex subunit ScpB [Clostridia bacterium]